MIVLIDAPTSRMRINAEFVDLAQKLMALAGGGSNARILLTCHRRFDLMGKMMEKLRTSFPKWSHFCSMMISARQSSLQHSASAQEFVFCSVPPTDKRGCSG